MARFTPDLFAFLRDLAANNDREWFNANKQRYEDSVRQPALDLPAPVGSQSTRRVGTMEIARDPVCPPHAFFVVEL